MKIAVAGATGRIGRLVVRHLHETGHDTVAISRSEGVDLRTGAGLDRALDGVDAVVDAVSYEGADVDEVVSFFTTTTDNLLRAEAAAGVRHHVLLSIVRVDEQPDANAHYRGKVEQEARVVAGPVPWTIVRATQFHDFPEMITTWVEQDGTATIPPLLLQPAAPSDVAAVLAEVAAGRPQGRHPDIAGPGPEDAVDMARRTREARGNPVRLVPTWEGVFDTRLAGNALLPGAEARLLPTSFDEWLAAQAAV